jgi:phenylalanyl-tRNA synthetase beta chain
MAAVLALFFYELFAGNFYIYTLPSMRVMPVIELDLKRLTQLVGEKIEPDKLVDAITRVGADVEGFDGKAITVEYFPDRPDLLSVEGTARALRAFMDLEPGLKTYKIHPPEIEMKVDKGILPIRGHIQCLDVKGVSLDEEQLKGLMDLQEDLHWAVGRDRKKVAIGVHDSSKIKPPYFYKASRPEEIKFIPLAMPGMEMSLGDILEKHPKGMEYAHVINRFEKYPIIVDSTDQVLSMPPIINGELTKLTLDTKEMFVEMTGTDENAVQKAMNILATAFAEQGWRIYQVGVNFPDQVRVTPDLNPIIRRLSIAYTNKMLGLSLSAKELVGCLKKMGYDAEVEGGRLNVSVPSYRNDILHDRSC